MSEGNGRLTDGLKQCLQLIYFQPSTMVMNSDKQNKTVHSRGRDEPLPKGGWTKPDRLRSSVIREKLRVNLPTHLKEPVEK